MFSIKVLEKGIFFIRIPRRHWARFRGFVSILIIFVFLLSSVLPSYAQSVLNLPVPGTMVNLSPAFVPVLLKGMTIDSKNPLYFDFIVDSGNTKFTQDQIKEESSRLVKYFLAAMTVPQDDLWVNLSPYEKDRIVPDALGKTELGQDMLAQDYILKQLTASLIYPEKEFGKAFWDKIYKKAYEQFGTTTIPVDTFNKVWIVPQEATVYENGNAVYIVKSHLKVMMEEDYLALANSEQRVEDSNDKDLSAKRSTLASDIVREIILPEIEREVNEGKNFAPIRQIYQSLILAQWYKETIKESLLSKVYIDQNKIKGVDLPDPTIKDQIYSRYVESFKKGVFDFIKTEYDQPSQRVIPRKYFSGGEKFGKIPLSRTQELGALSSSPAGDDYKLSLRIEPQKDGSNKPMDASSSNVDARKSYGKLIKLFNSDKEALNERLEGLILEYKEILNREITKEKLLEEEFIRVTDENGTYLKDASGNAQITTREIAHDKKILGDPQKKLWHRIASVLMLDLQGNVLVQVRSKTKDTKPGAYDVSAGGHIGIDDPEAGMKKEIEEEVFNEKHEIDPTRLVRIMPKGQYITSKDGAENATFFIYIITEEEKRKIIKQDKEVDAYEWKGLEVMQKLLGNYKWYRGLPKEIKLL
ncbi:MAG: NUDIX domain-containing protein [Candidatus Omnitrophica bacterium]|nr:NUDIX domain-containing protein [Candidatus Omnitrophota bacterium]